MSWENKLTVAAIDFGTAFSGYFISFLRDYSGDGTNRLRLIGSTWNSGSISTEKTPTVVLLDSKKDFHSFGYEAQNKYAELCEAEEHEHWYYFQNFKMKLYGDRRTRPIHLGSKISDEQGKEMPAVDVFAHAIKYLKDHIETIIGEKLAPQYSKEVFYILTCPAIWSEQSKLFMKTAAIHAQIPEDRLKIALEPECASVYIHREEIPGVQQQVWRYIIADIGGGTLDIAAHEINSSNKIEEIISPDGGPWGGNIVNFKFEQLLVSISGGEAFLNFKNNSMEDYLFITRGFEQKKCSFKKGPPVRLQIPSSFKDTHQQCNSEDLTTSLSQHQYSESVKLKGDKLHMESSAFLKLYDYSVDNIVDKIKSVLQATGPPVPLIYCVGGFSSSSVVKQRLTDEFSTKETRVVFPPDAVTAIMRGAVILARDETIVEKRTSKYTIGLDWNIKFNADLHPEGKREETDEDTLCKDIFRVIVRKGSVIETGKPVFQVTAYVKTATQTVIELPFYRSEISENPQFIDDVGCHLMGSMSIPMEDVTDGLDRYVHLTVYIDQMLHAEAVDKHGNKHMVNLFLGETVV